MREALDQLTPEPDFVLIDAMPLRYTEAELSLIKGDTKSISILCGVYHRKGNKR